MFIILETIPHTQQRYSTCGDWQYDRRTNDTLVVRVSQLGNRRYEMAVALHELVEAELCRAAGITEQEVDAFDLAWSPSGSPYAEPGDDPAAPYCRQHIIAGIIERLFLLAAGEDWTAYANALDALPQPSRRPAGPRPSEDTP